MTAPRGRGTAYSETSNGGWIGITDKYWLAALIPDQSQTLDGAMRYLPTPLGDGHAYQTDFITSAPETIAPGATAVDQTHVFTRRQAGRYARCLFNRV